MSAEAITVLIVDDHLVIRRGLAELLAAAPDIRVAGEAQSGEEGLALCQQLKPDVVLMDLRMPGMGGLAAAESIRRFHAGAKVLGLSTFAEDETAMMAAGAHGYLPKSATFDELVGAIRQVHAGGCVPRAASALAPPPVRHASPPTPAITPQQRRVLALMVKGFTNPEIARYLGVSASTAGYHVGAILEKLDVSNRAEAAAAAVRDRLIDEHDL
jgi:two-component system, NarL family, response regulator LiaR